jgi:hypothetical protein
MKNCCKTFEYEKISLKMKRKFSHEKLFSRKSHYANGVKLSILEHFIKQENPSKDYQLFMASRLIYKAFNALFFR